MRVLTYELETRIVDNTKLLQYGFALNNGLYCFRKKLNNNSFEVQVECDGKKMCSKIIDLENNLEYTFVDVATATGSYVGQIREEYEFILNDISLNFTTNEIFKSEQARIIMKYLKEKYHDEIEFLWERTPKNGICRHKETKKWYLAILTLKANKLGLDSNEDLEIIDLKASPEKIKKLIDYQNYFPGYHMNKKHWFTIILDGRIKNENIFRLIDESYDLK